MASAVLSNENQHTPAPPKPNIQADIPSDLHNGDSLRREVNSRRLWGKSESNNLHGEASLVSLTPKRRKRPDDCNKTVKVEFQMNFQNDEDKAEAMKMVSDLPGIDKISMNVKDETLKLEGDFDAKEVLERLEKICRTHLLISKQNFSSMPKTAKSENQSVLSSPLL